MIPGIRFERSTDGYDLIVFFIDLGPDDLLTAMGELHLDPTEPSVVNQVSPLLRSIMELLHERSLLIQSEVKVMSTVTLQTVAFVLTNPVHADRLEWEILEAARCTGPFMHLTTTALPANRTRQ